MRCQVHSELAVIEEEEGCLEASLTHLQKAIRLDDGTQSQRLSWALHLLQLRRTLHQTPSRTEEKAAKLLQQVNSSASNSSILSSFNKLHLKSQVQSKEKRNLLLRDLWMLNTTIALMRHIRVIIMPHKMTSACVLLCLGLW